VLRLSRIFLIINFKTLVVTFLAVLSTFICMRFELEANFPLTLLATAIVFPLVFSIGGAYKRREAALDDYGSIKAHGRSIFFAVRDWIKDGDPELQEEGKGLVGGIMTELRAMFTDDIARMEENEERIYAAFSRLSRFINVRLREKGLAAGEASRCNQYLSKMMVSFENIKHIYQYRTPRTLKAFSDLFITFLPLLYGPYFAHIAQDYTHGLEYVMPILFSVILVSLDNIQEHLENPFDQVGEDDITINVEKFVSRLDL